MKDPLGVSPSKGNQGTTRGKEKIILTSVGIEPTTSGLDLPLLCRLSYEVGQRKSERPPDKKSASLGSCRGYLLPCLLTSPPLTSSSFALVLGICHPTFTKSLSVHRVCRLQGNRQPRRKAHSNQYNMYVPSKTYRTA